ncbi:MAG TPA: T9SS type A sorting domain-containing protein, partial [Chitinophagaceae bacterium]|nr:T9SS type A sorting domain-containing protein [Chitinophagaceae bacterium]
STNSLNGDVVVLKLDCSNNVGVTDFDQKNTLINVYPNPAFDYITVESKSEIKSVQLEDMCSRKIDMRVSEGLGKELKLPITNLPSGVYILRVNGQYTVKWIKE